MAYILGGDDEERLQLRKKAQYPSTPVPPHIRIQACPPSPMAVGGAGSVFLLTMRWSGGDSEIHEQLSGIVLVLPSR